MFSVHSEDCALCARKGGVGMAGNLKIQALSNWSLGITAVLAILCIAVSILGFRKYEVLQSSTRDYIACEAARCV